MSTKHILKNIKNIKFTPNNIPRSQFVIPRKSQMAVATCPFSAMAAQKAQPQSGVAPATCPFSKVKFQTGKYSQEIPQPFRDTNLTQEQRELIKASVPALEAYGVKITELFYNNMLNAHEELKDIFNNANQAHLEQPKALANAVLAYAKNIDDPSPLLPVLNLIANKHVSMYVRPEHYQIVGKHLIEAIAEVLGDAITPELGAAWTLAYWKLAELLMKMEDDLMVKSKGWTDWAQFKIAKKVKESDEVTSFYLEPIEKSFSPLPQFQPGQYISIQIDAPALGHKQVRQYSLSDAPNSSYYRVSIKKESGLNGVAPTSQPGLVSVLMHETKNEGDIIEVSHPMGDFFLQDQQSDSPMVLLSGGVGLTPLNSMLQTVLQSNPSRSVSWIHGARSKKVRPFVEPIRQIAESKDNNVQVHWFNSHAEPEEVDGVDFHYRGFVDLNTLHPERTLFLNNDKARYYICGPTPFMLGTAKSLKQLGVPSDRVHMELFGTGGAPSA